MKAKVKRRVTLGIPSAESFGGLHWCFIGEKAHQRLRKAFAEIIYLLCDRRDGLTYQHKDMLFPVSYALKEIGLFDPGVPNMLRELNQAIDEAIEDARGRGEADGASLLKRLASGEATVQEFNEATIQESEQPNDR